MAIQTAEITYAIAKLQRRLDLVSSGVLIGRVSDGIGPIEELTVSDLLTLLGIASITAYLNAVKDVDSTMVMDLDGEMLYEPTDVIDNPCVPTRYFDTIADLLAEPGNTWDRAVTRNFLPGDGRRSEWRMAADPTLADNEDSILATDDGYGFAERVAVLG